MEVPSAELPRPRTGNPDDWEEDSDEDPGLFSYLRPSTADQPTSSHTFATFPTPLTPPTSQPRSLTPPGTAPDFITPPDPNPDQPLMPDGTSPAVAYAQIVQEGPRRRGGWMAPDTPSTIGQDAFSIQMTDPASSGFGFGASDRSNKISHASTRWGGYQGEDISMQDLGKELLPTHERRRHTATTGSSTLPYFGEGTTEEEDSPYPEVAASVSNYDDTELPALTFRAWFIGLLFSAIFGATNMFFNFRYPAPIILPIVPLILSYPLGNFMGFLLPAWEWKVPKVLRFIGSETLNLNPGPFNIKEHTVIFIMINTAISNGISLNLSIILRQEYSINYGVGFDLLLLMSTQMIGFAVAGLGRRFLISPASMIWPQNLMYCTLLNTLHAEDDDDVAGGRMSRFKFFLLVFAGAFVWYFLPGFLFQALSAFSYICWAAPNNVVVNQLFGVETGLGMGLFTFDWSQIAYLGSPLITPWWAEVNIFVGFVVAYWLVAPLLYYSNVWYSAYLPISAPLLFDRFGLPYNTSGVIDAVTHQLDLQAYENYSPPFLPITFALLYAMSLALATSAVVHTVLYHGRDIWSRLRTQTKLENEDIHAKLMRSYAEIPDWWYLIALVGWLAVAVGLCAGWSVNFPIWALLLSLLLCALYVLPAGFIFAMTGQMISINIIAELIAGYVMPENAIGVMMFKLYSTQSLGMGLSFVQDLKMGHYMKIPPKVTFTTQFVATAVACLAQLGLTEWLLNGVPDFCSDTNSAHLVCNFASVFNSSGIIWGLIGPSRQFGIGKLYNPIIWSLLVGAVLPVIFWSLERRFPRTRWLSMVNTPVMFTAGLFVPPASGINYSSWFVFGYIFQYWIRRRYFAWWSKYNFVLSAGLDSGTAMSGLFIFFALQLAKGGTLGVEWVGNSIFTTTADYNGFPYRTPPDAGFGPETW